MYLEFLWFCGVLCALLSGTWSGRKVVPSTMRLRDWLQPHSCGLVSEYQLLVSKRAKFELEVDPNDL
eukprot:1342121-Amphidinium_carterae.1